ncbi:MAG: hypothetical protein ACTHOB_03185 [Ginsengibacter sp.]
MRNQSKINRNLSFILIAFLFPVTTFSQDISGVWTGHIYNDTTRKNIHYELAINESDGKASGFSHTTFVFDSLENVGVKSVKIRIKKDRIEVVDDKFIYNNFPSPPPEGVKMYSFLTLSENDTTEVLSGTWMTNSTKIYNSVTGTIFLEKKKQRPDQTVIATKLIQLGLGNKLSFLPPAIVSRDMIAINAKPNSTQNILPGNNETSTTSSVPAQNETAKKPQQITSNEKQNQNVAKPQEKNEVAIKEQPENKKPNEPVDIVKKESVHESKNENLAKNEDINQKQTAAKVQVITTTTKEPKVISKNEPSQVPRQQKNAAPSKIENVDQKEVAVKESNKTIQSKDQVAQAEKQQQKPENLNNPQLAVSKPAKKIETNQPTEPRKQEPVNAAAKEQITPKISNENVANENQSKSSGPPPAAEISKRKIETIRTVDIVSKDSLQFSLYDNGTVDGDTVTVLINGKVVMPRVGLLERAINKTIYLTPDMGDSISVVMYAENLGSIPPNTGLLVIRDASRIYEIRFSGDLQKNSAIILVRKKKT